MTVMRRLCVPLIVSVSCVLVTAACAYGKGNVHATLEDPAQLQHAAGGERIRITWTLREPPPGGERAVARAFGASGVYVRLRGAVDSAGQTVRARSAGSAGRYVAQVTIPEGGISSIAIGLEGFRYVQGTAPARADVFFSIDNDPFISTSTDAEATAPWGPLAAGLAALGMLLAGYRMLGRRRAAT